MYTTVNVTELSGSNCIQTALAALWRVCGNHHECTIFRLRGRGEPVALST